jgi:putative transposase
MPRHARLDTKGALHHVIIRGIDGIDLFADDTDRQRFIDKLSEYVSSSGCSLYAWTLMSNHIHLLLKSGGIGLSATMRKLLTWYALYFNKRHKRKGHLFQNRYKSVLCEEETYLLALVRYIHLNPIRARIVPDLASLDRYPWSGHAVIMGRLPGDFMDTSYVLQRFGRNEGTARKGYRRFIKEGIGTNPDLMGGGLKRSLGWSEVLAVRKRKETVKGDERILGNSNFVLQVLSEAENVRPPSAPGRIKKTIKEECSKGQVSRVELESGVKRRSVTAVREMIALRSARELGLTAAEIARHLGVSTSAITKAIERAAGRLSQEMKDK